jgi:hypothetical protein
VLAASARAQVALAHHHCISLRWSSLRVSRTSQACGEGEFAGPDESCAPCEPPRSQRALLARCEVRAARSGSNRNRIQRAEMLTLRSPTRVLTLLARCKNLQNVQKTCKAFKKPDKPDKKFDLSADRV